MWENYQIYWLWLTTLLFIIWFPTNVISHFKHVTWALTSDSGYIISVCSTLTAKAENRIWWRGYQHHYNEDILETLNQNSTNNLNILNIDLLRFKCVMDVSAKRKTRFAFRIALNLLINSLSVYILVNSSKLRLHCLRNSIIESRFHSH